MRIIEFYANWCAPCRTTAPLVSAVAESSGVHLDIVNVDLDPVVAEMYGVRSIPHLVLEDDRGNVVYTGTGVGAIDGLRKAVEAL